MQQGDVWRFTGSVPGPLQRTPEQRCHLAWP